MHARERRRAKVMLRGAAIFTADLSPGGLSVELMRVLAPGTDVNGTITFQGQTFEFSGCVTWAKEGDARLGIRGRMGIRFTGIAPGFFLLLHTKG
jgi:hypothetical protein